MATAIALGMAPMLLGTVGVSADDPAGLDARIEAILERHGDGVAASVWVGDASGKVRYARQADTPRPTASAIKTAYLVELFARYADGLDRTPPGLDAILADTHPAVAHFTPARRDEIREALGGATVREVGGVMMGSVEASNTVYNAAANVTTALLGGPEGVTRAIRARDPAFAAISVRRYMLADRHATGDNGASASALAAVLRGVATGTLKGVDAATTGSIRRAMVTRDDLLGLAGRHHVKDGALNSDPLVRVLSGWRGAAGDDPGAVVYVIMLSQPNPGKLPRDKAGERLEETARRVGSAALEGVQ